MKAKGYEINQGDCTGHASLLWVAKNGHDGVLNLLLGRRDLDPERPDKGGNMPLHCRLITCMKGLSRYYNTRREICQSRAQSAR